MTWPHKHFVSLADWKPADMETLLDLAAAWKADSARYSKGGFSGGTAALLFEKDSLRTRVSFEVAVTQLGGFPLFIDLRGRRIGERESAEDQARVLSRYVDCIIMRTFSHQVVETFAKVASVPVVNALSDYCHPCQALADVLTIKERFGSLEGVNITFLGDGNNVARSLAWAGKLCGANVVVCTPPGYELPDKDSRAVDGPGEIAYSNDPAEAVAGANIVYTDVWASMGQETEADERERVFRPFQVNAELMNKSASGAGFMHCLPAHRGLEVSAEVIDSPASLVFDQAENRLHAQRALLGLLIEARRG